LKHEAVWVIANICASSNPDYISLLFQEDCIVPLCKSLDVPRSAGVVLWALYNISRTGKLGDLKRHLADFGVIDKIRALQRSDDEETSEKARDLLDSISEADEGEQRGVTKTITTGPHQVAGEAGFTETVSAASRERNGESDRDEFVPGENE
jgi:hypothetical protein